ncbi:probable ABC1 transport protein [Cephalotrichum gorgonifer]|uniref:Probable ABC1 transport protein n=1 Tax=Cephalotrichum gorgonifer TaxID=2041049 RepID=A0AAE8N8F1_9PEZI|nr:probable ABC1 transport protein [Cephalotrichum gorgonifer]
MHTRESSGTSERTVFEAVSPAHSHLQSQSQPQPQSEPQSEPQTPSDAHDDDNDNVDEWPSAYAPIRAANDRDGQGDHDAEADRIHGPSRNASFRRVNSVSIIDEDDRLELQRLASAISTRRRQSLATLPEALPPTAYTTAPLPNAGIDPALDPSSKSFDLGVWLRARISEMEGEGIELKQAGVAYSDLTVSGSGAAMRLQQTVGSLLMAPLRLGEHLSFGKRKPKTILKRFDGLLRSGELLIVLGRPGSGCSTLLKTMTGELSGLELSNESSINYNGVPQKEMMKEFKGEAVYNQEVDKHFPHLTVGQTLEFAAAARTPTNQPGVTSRSDLINEITKIVMAVCGLTHTYNTKVGDDFIRGVSGGERKRVSIAEMMLARSPIAAWDNSTRGLDSATALKFVQTLRLSSDLVGTANAVAIYQASQSIYDLFDKAVVLYEGRQIYFGPASAAKSYFERMGWHCPARQTTGDFLTSVTNPQERVAREGMEHKVPRTPDEFEARWLASDEYRLLREELEDHSQEFPVDAHGAAITSLRQQKNARQSKHVRPKSPYTIDIVTQVQLTTRRAYQRILGNISATATQAAMQVVLALIIGSAFYGTPNTTAGMFAKGSVIFQGVLLSALTAISEIHTLYSQRPIVEKQASYAFYHPFAEAVSGIVADIPIKFINITAFNIVLYFLAGLRLAPGGFFLYFLVTYVTTFVMTAVFRTIAALTKTVSQAMMLAGIMVLALVIYTGFVIHVPQMHPWFGWIRWINPVYYAFEMLIANEFHGRRFDCAAADIVPAYGPQTGDPRAWICSTVGSKVGERATSGDAFIETNYGYYFSHMWRNFGILIGFLIFFMILYIVATELNSATGSEAEVLVFRRGMVPARLTQGAEDRAAVVDRTAENEKSAASGEPGGNVGGLEPQKDIFTWRDVVYDVPVKGGTRRLLNHVSGWVKPGTLTALMGVSGAGKTTLLDVLAQRTSVGVITGDMFVNGKPLDASFQRKTGYVQQQDLHLETSTVRESLRFSAYLRQPPTVSKAEKNDFVESVIDMLAMRDFADAIVGVPGSGLNVEQRKLLTIGVELAARPKLLLFLDEPTSGLDSQSSWAICAFLRKLADSGQAVLCTVHQPSAVLFQQFDRLLFLAAGGKTVYFGDIGQDSQTLLGYFEGNGARKCGSEENPAEYMLEVVNAGTNPQGEDWHSVWKGSAESRAVTEEMERIHAETAGRVAEEGDDGGKRGHAEFAMPFGAQLKEVTVRVFQQYWRTPAYVFSKFLLGILAGLFIGFSFFQADSTLAGMQNILFSVFMVVTIFTTLVQQIHPHFLTQRSLYEVRERPSKAYSWKAFMIANVIVEIPYQIMTGILIWACFYYPVTGIQSPDRQGLVLLFCIQIMLYASSFAQMTIAALPDSQTASSLVTLLVLMSLTFCGVMQTPSALPGFWIFMYRVSPFTYWVGGIVATELHDRKVECSASETAIFSPPDGMNCGEYMRDYLTQAPGTLQNPDARSDCRYCSLTVADQFMAASDIYWSDRWRNFGILWGYILFNIALAVFTYWAFRVKKWNFKGKKKA